MTVREMLHLEAQLPAEDFAALDRGGIPAADAERFGKLYRHFPWFVDADI